MLLSPANELGHDVVGELEGEEEPDPLISLDGSRRGHAGVCRLSNNRRTR